MKGLKTKPEHQEKMQETALNLLSDLGFSKKEDSLPPKKLCSHSIVIIEDDVVSAKIVEKFLDNLGYDTMTFHHPVKALNEIKLDEVCLMFIDLKLPEMNGLEFIEKIRETGTQIPTVVITGYTKKDIVKKALQMKIQSILTKPTDLKRVGTLAETYAERAKRDST